MTEGKDDVNMKTTGFSPDSPPNQKWGGGRLSQIERQITWIRESFAGSGTYFTSGGCYDFACILRFLYPEAELWFVYWGRDGEPGAVEHVITKIGCEFYDINGIFTPKPGQVIRKLNGKYLEKAREFRYEI